MAQVAQHFERQSKQQDEDESLEGFLTSHARYLRIAQAHEPPPTKRARLSHGDTRDGNDDTMDCDDATSYGTPARRSVDGYGPAREGEQVAALTEDEDGSVQWILAVVHKYYAAEVFFG